jgi:hypothetical protein
MTQRDQQISRSMWPGLLGSWGPAGALTFLLVISSPATALQENGSGTAAVNTVAVPGNTAAPRNDAAPGIGRCSMNIAENETTTTQAITYVPPSAHCKFDLFLQQTYSPYTFASTGFQAAWAQATGRWPHYYGGLQGFGKRFGATLADTESRKFIQGYALSTLLHQDPRYFPSQKKRLFARTWYAVTRVAVGRSDDGSSTFNSPEFLGSLFASALQNSYYPRVDRTLGDTMDRFAGSLTSDVLDDLLHEFAPDMKRLFRRWAPPTVKRIERELPIPAEDKP